MFEHISTWPPRRWARFILIAFVAAVLLYVIIRAFTVLIPFLLGLIIGYIILPLVDRLQHYLGKLIRNCKVARVLAILIVYIIGLGLIAAFFLYLVPLVIDQVNELIKNSDKILADIQGRLAGLREFYMRNVPEAVRRSLESQFEGLSSRLLAAVGSTFTAAVTAIGNTIIAIFGFLIIPFWLFYILYDLGCSEKGLTGVIPEGIQPDIINVGRIGDDILGAYLRGQLLVAATVGILTGVGLYLIGVDFAVLLGLITGIGNLIPTFGAILAGIPTFIIAFLEQPILGLWAILILIAVQQFESFLIGPRVIGQSVQLSPAIIIVLLVVAAEVWGLLGLLFVVPVAAFLRDTVRYLYLRTSAKEITPNEALHRVREGRRRKRA